LVVTTGGPTAPHRVAHVRAILATLLLNKVGRERYREGSRTGSANAGAARAIALKHSFGRGAVLIRLRFGPTRCLAAGLLADLHTAFAVLIDWAWSPSSRDLIASPRALPWTIP
jgi:hypothetical protein